MEREKIYEPLIGNMSKQIDIAYEKWQVSSRNWISNESNPLKIFDYIDDYVNRSGAKIIHISSNNQRSDTLKLKGVQLNPKTFSNVYLPQGKDSLSSIAWDYHFLINSLKSLKTSKYLDKVELTYNYIKSLNLIEENFSLVLPERKFFESGLSFISDCSDEDALLILFQFLRERKLSTRQYLIVLDNMFLDLIQNEFLTILYKSSRAYNFSFAVTGDINQYEKEHGLLSFSSILVSDKGVSNFELNKVFN